MRRGPIEHSYAERFQHFLFFPSEATWIRIESWLDAYSAAGDWFGMGDLLIVAISADREDTVWSLDGDFSRMDTLKLIKLYRST